MKAIEQYFHVVLFIMLDKMVLTFKSVDEILKCDHSNESYLFKAVLNFWGWTTFEVWHKPFNCAFHQQRQQDASNSTENWKSIHCLQSWRKRKKIIHNKNIYTNIKMKSLFLRTNLDLGSEQQLTELNFAHPLLPPRILRDFLTITPRGSCWKDTTTSLDLWNSLIIPQIIIGLDTRS